MSRFSLLWALIALAGLSGCGSLVQDVSVDKIPATQPKLVVQSFISPQDTVLAVYVDQPTSVLGLYTNTGYSNQRFPIQNAVVDVSDGTRTVLLSKRNISSLSPNYSSDLYYGVSTKAFPIVVGRTYTLTASAPGYPSVTATCTVPAAVQPTEIRLDSTTRTEFGQRQRVYTAQLAWQDPAGTANFYRITGEAVFNYSYRITTSGVSRDTTAYQTRQLAIDSNGSTDRRGADQLSDQGREGQQLTASGQLILYSTIDRPQTFSLRLSNVEASMYQFITAVQRQRQQGDNPFAEPVLVSSNIQNGLGCFGAYNQATLTVRAK